MVQDLPSVRSPYFYRGTVIALGGLAVFAVIQLIMVGVGAQRQRSVAKPAPPLVKPATIPERSRKSDARSLADEVFPPPRRPSIGHRPSATVPPPPPRMHAIESRPAPVAQAESPPAELSDGDNASQGPAPLTNEIAVRSVELSKMAEVDQDIFGAIQYLLRANRNEPNHPDILYRLGVLYDRFGNERKSRDYFAAILTLGPEKSGQFATLASHYLSGNHQTETKGGLLHRPLSVGSVGTDLQKTAAGSREITLSMSIRSLPGEAINMAHVEPHIWFYDLVDGEELVQIAGEQPADQKYYRSEYPDWKDPEEELLDVIYKADRLDPQSGEEREFFGYVIKLYYNDEIQDVVAEPRVLLELLANSESAGPDNSLLDPALFDN